jgi:hypothetical protein
MLGTVTPVVLIALFAIGYGTRSYVGALVPGVIFVCAVALYVDRGPPSGDEVDVLPGMFMIACGIGVLLYVAGVALARRSCRSSSDGATFR